MIMGKWKVDVMYSLFDLHNHNLRSFLCHNDFSYDDTNLGTFLTIDIYFLFLCQSLSWLVLTHISIYIFYQAEYLFLFIRALLT